MSRGEVLGGGASLEMKATLAALIGALTRGTIAICLSRFVVDEDVARGMAQLKLFLPWVRQTS